MKQFCRDTVRDGALLFYRVRVRVRLTLTLTLLSETGALLFYNVRTADRTSRKVGGWLRFSIGGKFRQFLQNGVVCMRILMLKCSALLPRMLSWSFRTRIASWTT